MRLKLFGTPALCIMASMVASRQVISSILLKQTEQNDKLVNFLEEKFHAHCLWAHQNVFYFLVFQFFGQQECPSSNLNYDISSDGSPRNCQFKDPVCMFNSFFFIF